MKWDWLFISFNRNITPEIIRSNPNLPWTRVTISQNPNITLEFINEYHNKPWNWHWIYL